MQQNINTIEGAIHNLRVNFLGEVDFTEYSVYGSCKQFGGCHCVHFKVTEQDETGCDIEIPALKSGVYKYQLFIKQEVIHKEFLVLEGEITAKARICDCDEAITTNAESTIIDATISADNIEVNITIEKGLRGEPGPKGDKGDSADISEETIKEMLPMVWDIKTPSTADQYFKDGVVIGENNKGGSNLIYIFGKDNEATRNKGILVGFSNYSKGGLNAILGDGNQISGQQNSVFGSSNIIPSSYQQNVVLGTQNRPQSSNNVIVGSWNETFLGGNGNFNFIFGESNNISGKENTVLGQSNFVSGMENATIGYKNAVCYQSYGTQQAIDEGFNITVGSNNFVGGGFDFGFFTSNAITLGNRSSNHKNNSIVVGHDISAKNDNSIILCASDTNNGVKVSMELTAGKATGKMGDLGSGEPFVTDCFITFYIEDILGGMTQRTKINLKNFLEVFAAYNGETEHEMIQNGGYYY